MGYGLKLALSAILLAFFIYIPNVEASGGGHDFPENASFSTLIKMPLTMQGLASGPDGYLYAAGRNTPAGVPCPIWRVDPNNPTLVVVGFVPAANSMTSCIVIGLAFNQNGDLFVGDTVTGRIYSFTPDESSPPLATEFGTAANGLANIAFDQDGNLWATDGPSNQGRVWKIPAGGAGVVQFRIPPLRNSLGIGRDTNRFPLGNALGLGVATGLAFNADGELFITDVSRGVIWKAEFYRDGGLRSKIGCDTTYPADTLCLENAFVQHPILSGAGGIAIDRKGNLWVTSIDRNSMTWISRDGEVAEVFRNPVSETTGRRNEGPLEFPAVPVLIGGLLCVSNLDSDIQDNSPNSGGDISPAGPDRGKIACMDQGTFTPGLPLPVGSDRGNHHKPWLWPR
ncbi:MAG TPA: SMP-30/gluconolactonase/LRE family protein [bacterium]|nr:SMP-30/gluconolactonase/LRE family protein [bacterium]